MTIRVLIIDDSATMRAILKSYLSGEPDIEVVGTAGDAAQGRAAIKQLDPDVVTLDIEMPGMNGLDFLEKIMELRPTPVIVVSGSTQHGNATTARALAIGAIDCYAKSQAAQGGMCLKDNGRLAAMVRQAAQVRFSPRPRSPLAANAPRATTIDTNARLIAVGSSTGGVEALQVLFSSFTPNCPPTMVVQHVNARFVPAIANSLDNVTTAKVVVAEPDMPLQKGHIYIAPGDERHMGVGGRESLYVKLRPGEPVSGHMPSVDMLFHSVAEIVGPQAVGILLTGMGSDGAKGLLAMAQNGAHTIAQDEASCIVFGMPKAAISLGAASVVVPLNRIAEHALRKAA